jgi:hypothetical protein
MIRGFLLLKKWIQLVTSPNTEKWPHHNTPKVASWALCLDTVMVVPSAHQSSISHAIIIHDLISFYSQPGRLQTIRSWTEAWNKTENQWMQAHPPGEICRSMMATEMNIGLPWKIVVLHSLSTVSCMDCCLHHHTADLCFSYTCNSEFKTSKQMTHLLHLMDNNPFLIFSICVP